MFSYSIKDSWDIYRENTTAKFKTPNRPLSRIEYIAFLSDFMKFISKLLIEGYELSLPESTGIFEIVGKNINLEFKNNINWKATKEYWEKNEEAKNNKTLIKHLNEHSDFKIYSIKWNKSTIRNPQNGISSTDGYYRNKLFYKFINTRGNKRMMAKIIKEEGQQYRILY